MSLLPAPPDSGIVFRRTDLSPAVDVPTRADWLREATMCSTLVNEEGVKIATIEHLMSAFAGLGVDNCIVELSSPEVPIMDGSSAPFVFLLQSVGLRDQGVPKRFMRIRQPVQVQDGEKWARFEPYDGFRLAFTIDFEHPALRSTQQSSTIEFSSTQYIREVARARTFGFMRELDQLRAHNLGLGASLDNVVALDDFRVVNPDGLRYDDEFVRHKILDAVGDLYLLGHHVIGAYSAFKSGHSLNNQLVRAVLADRKAWDWVSFAEDEPSPVQFMPATTLAAA